MNNPNELDRIIKGKLDGYASPTPTHLWDEIQARRSTRTRGRGIFPFSWLTLLLLLSSVIILGVGIAIAQSVWEDQPLQAFFNTAEITPLDAQTSELALIEQAMISMPTTTSQSEAFKTATQGETTNLNSIFTEKIPTEQPAALVYTNEVKALPHKSEKSNQLEQISTIGENLVRNLSDSKTTSAFQEADALLKRNSVSAFLPLETNGLAQVNRTRKMPTGSKCADFDAKGISWYLDLYGSPDLPIRTLVARELAFAEYAQERTATEKLSSAFSTGFRVGGVSAQGISLRTGLNYSQINEWFEYVNEDEIRVNIQHITDPDGNILYSDTSYQPGTRIVKTLNKYRILDIPVAVGYELELTNFVLSIHGGVLFNLLFEQKGTLLSPIDQQPISFAEANNQSGALFRNHLGLSLAGSFGLHYELNPRMRLLVEPNFRYYVRTFSNELNAINQSYFVTGMRLGLRLKI